MSVVCMKIPLSEYSLLRTYLLVFHGNLLLVLFLLLRGEFAGVYIEKLAPDDARYETADNAGSSYSHEEGTPAYVAAVWFVAAITKTETAASSGARAQHRHYPPAYWVADVMIFRGDAVAIDIFYATQTAV